MKRNYRHTKVIFTVGPATESEEMLERVILGGADVCRFNMAHATHEWVSQVARRIRRICLRLGREIALMMDIKGPEIRTGTRDEAVTLKKGQRLRLVTENWNGEDDGVLTVSVNYPGLPRDIRQGATVLVDNGLLKFEAVDVGENHIDCEVTLGGELGSKRHINLPGTRVNLPSVTKKDIADIAVGMEEGFTFYALSFVREAEDVDLLRYHLKKSGSRARIISKIEDQQALTNLDAIIRSSDGLMVARGDLGIECPYEELPIIQRRAVKTCIELGKPVIVATHMLESMIQNPLPTRAEVTDVANAVYEQADCVMLSGETTVGKYPLDCLEVMTRIAQRIEQMPGAGYAADRKLLDPRAKLVRSATVLAQELGGVPILLFTRTGRLAEILSSLRPPRSPLFAVADRLDILRACMPLWGIEPFLMEFSEDPEHTIQDAFQMLIRRGWVHSGEEIVVITNALAGVNIIDTVQIRYID